MGQLVQLLASEFLFQDRVFEPYSLQYTSAIIHERTIIVPKERTGRLDRFLASMLPDYSRSVIQRAITEGQIFVNGKRKKAHSIVHPGDVIRISIPRAEQRGITQEKMQLRVLYEDDHLLAIDKPPGRVTHPACGHTHGTIVHALLAHTQGKLSKGSAPDRPGIVHRLDKDTSGVLLIAKTDRAHRSLARALKKRAVKKEYLALVSGHVKPEAGIIDAPIHRDPKNRKRMTVAGSDGSREARTRYETVKQFHNATLLRIYPETGRTHQIRVHLRSIGYPVIGDSVYGNPKINRLFEKKYGLARQFLHASRITFIHPSTKKECAIESALPRDLATMLNLLLH